ncbi:MAG: hypothetical protein P1P84_08950, partial [Deferrisomatales bacterium]|nr:hypothetical protein [Deferrisomatales bacterium]
SAERGATGGVGEIARQAALLGVAEAKLRDLQRACREAGFTAEEFSRLMTLVTRAKLAGLPHQQLLSKLDEGLAKRAMPERVLGALEAKARRLGDAKGVVDQLIVQGWLAPDYPMAVGLVADALGAGASPAELVRAVRDGRAGAQGVPDVRSAFVGLGR